MEKAVDKQARMDSKISTIEECLAQKTELGYKKKKERIEALKKFERVVQWAAAPVMAEAKKKQKSEVFNDKDSLSSSSSKEESKRSGRRRFSGGKHSFLRLVLILSFLHVASDDDETFRSCVSDSEDEDYLDIVKPVQGWQEEVPLTGDFKVDFYRELPLITDEEERSKGITLNNIFRVYKHREDCFGRPMGSDAHGQLAVFD